MTQNPSSKNNQHGHANGIAAALGAAALFGASTPIAKWLLADVSPWMLASLLYLGSGIGLTLYRLVIRADKVRLPPQESIWFAGAILSGGVLAPVLLMYGLTRMSASGASLLLNAESVFTAALAWFAFRENVDRRIFLGMLSIVAGAIFLSWPDTVAFDALWPSLAVLGACFCWGMDNNLTRKVSLNDAAWIASIKGLVAGSVNLVLALLLHNPLPNFSVAVFALLTGFFAYGVSLTLFVIGLRHLGTARTGAYFSGAPFVGAALSLIMGEALTTSLLFGGLLMAIGIWLHLTEHHEHLHTHEALEHEHAHTHDEHHQHDHEGMAFLSGEKHTHKHKHEPLAHQHAHYPDIHHQHSH